MKGTAAVLWTLYGHAYSGSAETLDDRVELRTRGRTFAFPFSTIVRLVIERGANARLNGLPVLSMTLVDGDVVRVASLQGAGVLHELTASLAPQPAAASY